MTDRDLRSDWSVDEIVDALSDELAAYLIAAGHGRASSAESVLIDRAFSEMSEDDPATARWLSKDENRLLVEASARVKLDR